MQLMLRLKMSCSAPIKIREMNSRHPFFNHTLLLFLLARLCFIKYVTTLQIESDLETKSFKLLLGASALLFVWACKASLRVTVFSLSLFSLLHAELRVFYCKLP